MSRLFSLAEAHDQLFAAGWASGPAGIAAAARRPGLGTPIGESLPFTAQDVARLRGLK